VIDVPALSRREKELLEPIAQGFTDSHIPEKLFVSPFTVDSHGKNLLKKLNVNDAAILIRFAVKN
jgi:DNA-binding NarL/FixJ family response regulator